jgi:hypothetical protein
MIKRKIKKIFSNQKREKKQTYNRFFFVHIPKTAGTSFRLSLESTFEIVKDYGNNSKSTSSVVQQYSYNENDLFQMEKQLANKQNIFLSGHTPLIKYIDFVPVENTITFVREPLEQILSHYNHYVSHHHFTGTLDDFLEKPFAKNFQSKFIQMLPLGLIGFVGLTEQYDQSIEMINNQYSLDLASKKVNVNKSKQFTEKVLGKDLNNKFLKNNQQDLAMYDEAIFLHSQRMILHRDNKAWTYNSVNINQHNVLNGCAFQINNNQAIRLVVKVSNEVLQIIAAKHFYGAYVKANFPRKRYIAFSLPLPKHLTAEDEIDLYVEETGQKLNCNTLRINTK